MLTVSTYLDFVHHGYLRVHNSGTRTVLSATANVLTDNSIDQPLERNWRIPWQGLSVPFAQIRHDQTLVLDMRTKINFINPDDPPWAIQMTNYGFLGHSEDVKELAMATWLVREPDSEILLEVKISNELDEGAEEQISTTVQLKIGLSDGNFHKLLFEIA